MKGIYKAFIFLLIFQMSAFIVGMLGIFPYSMYSDVDFSSMPSGNDPVSYVQYFFGAGYGDITTTLAALGISGVILGVTILMSALQGSLTPFMVGIFGVMALHMLATSKEFIGTVFEKGGPAVMYLGVCLFVVLGAMILFAVIEHPSGGDSG
jgi:hypothetical protein